MSRWVYPKIGGTPPKWMVKIVENPIKMGGLGVPLFLETPRSLLNFLSIICNYNSWFLIIPQWHVAGQTKLVGVIRSVLVGVSSSSWRLRNVIFDFYCGEESHEKKPFTASWVKQIKLQVGKSKRSLLSGAILPPPPQESYELPP